MPKRCFVISPIGEEGSEIREHADAVFDYYIKPAMEECGIEAFRSDHLQEPGLISNQMFRAILGDDLCIALLTYKNANVFYELAIAQAASRPVIVMMEKGNDLPFDIKDLRAVYYDLKPRSVAERVYARDIVEHVKHFDASNWRVEGPLDGFLPSADDNVSLLPKARDLGGPESWMELLGSSHQEFDSVGIHLQEWRRDHGFEETLAEKLDRGLRARFMVMDPDNPSLAGLLNESMEPLDEVMVTLRRMCDYYSELAARHDELELRLIKVGCTHFNMTRSDAGAVAIQYLYSERASLSPLVRAKADTPMYATLKREFETLWKANAP